VRICGVDLDSKSITWAILDVGLPGVILHRIEDKGRKAEDRFPSLIKQAVIAMTSFAACNWTYIEAPIVGPNRKSALDQGMMLGAFRALLLGKDIPHSLVSIGTWKKATLGTGAATKEEIKRWAIQYYHLDSNLLQDFYDAVAIAHFGVGSTN
jgi:Holliday junction resolvasome RuvABC endonuclease subunit